MGVFSIVNHENHKKKDLIVVNANILLKCLHDSKGL